jgi:hypothetical protein
MVGHVLLLSSAIEDAEFAPEVDLNRFGKKAFEIALFNRTSYPL